MFFARAHNLEHAECLLKEHLEGSADNELGGNGFGMQRSQAALAG
jgi:hypothetical protein